MKTPYRPRELGDATRAALANLPVVVTGLRQAGAVAAAFRGSGDPASEAIRS